MIILSNWQDFIIIAISFLFYSNHYSSVIYFFIIYSSVVYSSVFFSSVYSSVVSSVVSSFCHFIVLTLIPFTSI